MNNQGNIFRFSLLLLALPFVATAAVSANQWMLNDNPMELGVLEFDGPVASAISSVRAQTVAVNANGIIEGRVAALNGEMTNALGGLSIRFLRDGQIIRETMTSQDGTFSIQGIEPGAYSFVAMGDNGFAAYGIKVVNQTDQELSNVIEVASVSSDFAAVQEILNESAPSAVSSELAAVSGDLPAGANRVTLVDGTLTGSVQSLIGNNSQARVTLVNQDGRIASIETEQNGQFSIENLEPGVYGLVAKSAGGFAAVGFEAVALETNARMDLNQDEIPVSFNASAKSAQEPVDSLDVTLAPDADTFVSTMSQPEPVYTSEFPQVEYVTEDVMLGGAGGACGGGCGGGCPTSGVYGGAGGGGGGLGGFGRLAAIGGLAIGIVALADDDDSAPASPVNP